MNLSHNDIMVDSLSKLHEDLWKGKDFEEEIKTDTEENSGKHIPIR